MPTATQDTWPLATPRIRIAPSLLAADFARLADDVAKIEAAGAEILHLDIMDGHFVPNISFGIPVIEKLRQVSRLFFDTHLMITEPVRYAEPFVKAGSDLLTFHIEVSHEPLRVVDHIRGAGARVGVTLNPGTEVSALREVVASVDLVLVMSVWPGFGGQTFIASTLDKCRALRGLLRADQRLEVDGGIGPDTVAAVVRAGADTLVAGSAVFGRADPGGAMRELERLAGRA
ncbi:MAG TPA: ribulose-phosphate 3-epimerase [Phycisphaerae bacterium]|nr:ribulose-phosphate 3-epimerase [Phycisphaerae bacterium]HRY66878.1 ribulose-phosphate 3-epimerase [Phycisphaerae bacterium]HSA26936.1 ribulose-phosphate 3-epimerase [Phycisphaerae bacterium]